MKDVVKDLLGGILFFGIVFGTCLLCCAASGYHWE